MYGFSLFISVVLSLVICFTTGFVFSGFGIVVVALVIFGLLKLGSSIYASIRASKAGPDPQRPS